MKRKDGKKELNLVVETKDVETKSSLRLTEQVKIDCAKILFEQLRLDGFEVRFETQISDKKMQEIVTDLLSAETL